MPSESAVRRTPAVPAQRVAAGLMPDSTVVMWALGGTHPFKVMHQPTCRYARRPYRLFHGETIDEVMYTLTKDDSWKWHKGCAICCPELYHQLATLHRRAFKEKQ